MDQNDSHNVRFYCRISANPFAIKGKTFDPGQSKAKTASASRRNAVTMRYIRCPAGVVPSDEVIYFGIFIPEDTLREMNGNGTSRSAIRIGMRVRIVLKQHQRSGALTEGIVKDILTSSPTHPPWY